MEELIRMVLMIEDANKSLRRLFPDYDQQAEPCREIIRWHMQQLETDNVLNALTVVLNKTQEEYGDSQKAQVHTMWFCAAAVDVMKEK